MELPMGMGMGISGVPSPREQEEKNEQVEETCDGVRRGLVGEMISRFEKKALELTGLNLLQCPKDLAEGGGGYEDRISELADDILALILSYLGLKEAGRTSILSRRWRGQWAFTNRLRFVTSVPWRGHTKETLDHKRHHFVEWVNRVLALHKSSTLEEFKVSFDLNEDWKSDIDEWLKFALARGVQILDLDLSWDSSGLHLRDKFQNHYPFLSNEINNISPKRSSSCWDISVEAGLKDVRFQCVNVSGEAVEYLLSNCPLLERLVVAKSELLINLRVTNPSLALKHLEILRCWKIQSIEICNVNLVSFVYMGVIKTLPSFRLENVPLLVDLHVSSSSPCVAMEEVLFPHLSCCSHQLKTLGFSVNENANVFRGFNAPPVFSNLKKFALISTASFDECLLGYMSLLESCPLLQKFVFEITGPSQEISKREVKKVSKSRAKKHQRLEEVEMIGYKGRKCELELVAYFLDNAVALKRIIVHPMTLLPQWFLDAEYHERDKEMQIRAKIDLERKVPKPIELIINI